MKLEIRSTGSMRTHAGRVSGYAAVFDAQAELPGFVETVKPGAFARSLQSGRNIRALYHHEGSSLLGSTRATTLALREDEKGLAFDLELPATTYAKDLAVLIERGDVAGCSFGFTVPAGGDRWEKRAGVWHRDLTEIELHEVTLTADPAYSDTTLALRTRPVDVDRNQLWMMTV